MAAVAVAQPQDAPIYPDVSERIRDEIRAQQRAMIASPERAKPAAELSVTARYLFRTKPEAGIKRVVHTIDAKPEVDGPEDRKGAFYLTRWEKRHKDDPNYGARMERLVDLVGGRTIAFQQVMGHAECWFATDDAELAAYLRDLVERGVGDFAHVYETNGKSRLIVGSDAFPNTALGWEAARRAAQRQGVADIKIVE